jgi:cytochrome P450
MQDASYPFDMLSPDFVQDPVPMIARMHAEAPIFFDPRVNGWMVGSHRVTKALEREPRLSAGRAGYVSALTPQQLQERVAPLVAWYAEWIAMRDGNDHRRLRQLAAHAFTPRNVEHLRERVIAVAEPILDAALARGELEVLGELAFPVPRTIICEMLGIPESDVDLFSRWTPSVTNLLSASLHTDEVVDDVFATRTQIHDYFVALIEARRRAPREGEILTSLVQAIEGSDSLTVDEIIDLAVFIMTGGYDTSTHLIDSGLKLLLEHPEQLAAVQADPSKIDGWIEETLRCDPQIAINTRLVTEGFEHEGHRLEPGQMVYLLTLASNRDPEHFADPNRFDIERKNAREHTTFGFGVHHCLGAPLARMEARAVFQTIFEKARELRLPEQSFERVPTVLLRGWKSLRVELS